MRNYTTHRVTAQRVALFFSFLLLVSTFFSFMVPLSSALITVNEYYDDFEVATFPETNYTQTTNWEISNFVHYHGAQSARFIPLGAPWRGFLTLNLSKIGTFDVMLVSQVVVTYVVYNGMGPANCFSFQYYNGTAWYDIINTTVPLGFTVYTGYINASTNVMPSNACIRFWADGFTLVPYVDCIDIDFVYFAPENPSIIIDGGAATTSDTDLNLTLSCDNATDMYFSGDNATWDGPYPYNTTYDPYTILCGSGNNTVYVWFYDNATNMSAYANDSINLTCSVTQASIINPPPGSGYIAEDWGAGPHNLVFTLNRTLDPSETLAVTIDGGYMMTVVSPEQYLNGTTYTMDLKPYVFFDDWAYNVTVTVTSCCGYFRNTTFFSIGITNESALYHLALTDLSPLQENFSQIDKLNEGVTYLVCSNMSEPVGIPYSIFLTDWNGNVISKMDDIAYLDIQLGWQGKLQFLDRFITREFYKVWIGVDYATYTVNGTPIISFDDLYPPATSLINASFMSANLFSYTYNTSNNDYQIYYGANGSSQYTGVVWGFGTFRTDDIIPFHSIGGLYENPVTYGSDWAQMFEGLFPGAGIVALCIIVAFFSLIPVILTHTFPPMAIQLFFSEMGLAVSYAMGLIPTWVFELILIGVILAIFYKVISWYRERTGAPSFADNPVGPELYQRGKEAGVKGAMGAKGLAKWTGRRLQKIWKTGAFHPPGDRLK